MCALKINGNMENFSDLKQLLEIWRVSELFEYFQEENINIAELKMLKINHLPALLVNFKFGTRIRFEYHWERWRREIGKTLSEAESVIILDDNINSNIQQTECDDISPTLKASSGKLSTHQKIISPKLSPMPIQPNEEQALESVDLVTDQETSNTMKSPRNKIVVPLEDLLENSGCKGQYLLKLSKLRKILTNEQRYLLIQLIAEFYHTNSLHLSLGISYALEREILKLFPGEKLNFYRTEKRGKIYVKITNLRRNKKFRTSCDETVTPTLKRYERVSSEIDYEPELCTANTKDGDFIESTDIKMEFEEHLT